MNSDKFLHLIANPNMVSKKQTIALDAVLEEFPYFQTARVLHLKGLKNQHSFKYNKALKKTAAYTTNRTVLFDFITKNTLDYESVSKKEQNVLNDIEVVDSKIIDHLHKSIIESNKNKIISDKQAENKLDVEKNIKDLKETKEEEIVDAKSNNTIEKNKDVLKIGKPIEFNKNDSFSFSEWLQIETIKPVERDLIVNNNQEEVVKVEKNNTKDKVVLDNLVKDSTKNRDLVSRFIKNNPKIKPIKNQIVSNVSVEGIQENTNLMTETLACVYLEQKKYKKAIAAFKILSLKYPEKSSFFADRIKAIQFLENHKS